MKYGDHSFTGSALVGVPLISTRSKHVGMVLTASWADTTDLWEEEISKDGKQYFVDG